MKYDIGVMDISLTEAIVHNILQCGSRSVGLHKALERWIKVFLSADGADIINIFGDPDRYEFIEAQVRTGLLNTNNYILSAQDGQSQPENETFKDCRIKSLDIDTKTSSLNIKLEFEVLSETVEIIL